LSGRGRAAAAACSGVFISRAGLAAGGLAWRGVGDISRSGGAKPSRACEIDGGRGRSTAGRLCMRFSVTAAAPLRAASQPA